MDAARVMLESTGTPLKTIAYECAFRDAHRMRGAFKRRLGVSPQQYRLNFSAPGSEANG
jgi:transcriptional regulator GlxA family with amidase domain